ncbi:uncharacterized protein LOC110723847 [Chenopodium quinoa]|uniref:uncharacterized protein LOC110723847 n=1 Tax=Chenopodium quinoa TaxID=63459 RepID=UPI000B788489|nr:uncharacterized protein LOC110723847 [Chenopodium quinoa]XP_021758933.1 uncharacterized protein LOC110723847 [Chenopodium quinoa]XP_021758934.1 uncharacterized protein LOC110723847 [Chenopodium quinoa]
MENRYLRQYRSEEFQEEDVWAVVKEESETGFKIGESNGCPRTPHSFSRRLPSAARMIPGSQKHQHVDNSKKFELVQSSAPVNVPDWSKIYGKSPIEKNNGSCSSFLDRNRDCNDYYTVRDAAGSDEDEDYENENEGDGELPPHEWLAKKLARSQISSFSVCEGVGRTLKGRDLSRVRNAILSKTGFL